MKNTQRKTIYLAIIAFLLVIGVICYGDYLIKNRIVEYFTTESASTNHTISLPINTDYTCNNFCGPMARCSMTGEQCSTDADCPGCSQYFNKPPENTTPEVPGYDDSGKLTSQTTPTFSVLVTDIGTQATQINSSAQPVQYNIGYNTWRKTFDKGSQIFQLKNDLGSLSYMPKYPERVTLSGEFTDVGPLPANANL